MIPLLAVELPASVSYWETDEIFFKSTAPSKSTRASWAAHTGLRVE